MVARGTTFITLLLLASADAFTQSSSSFGGKNVFASTQMRQQQRSPARGEITMKKGKANVPPNMRAQYKRQQEMGRMRDEMVAAQNPGADGLPVFNLFVRTKRANVSVQYCASSEIFYVDIIAQVIIFMCLMESMYID